MWQQVKYFKKGYQKQSTINAAKDVRKTRRDFVGNLDNGHTLVVKIATPKTKEKHIDIKTPLANGILLNTK